MKKTNRALSFVLSLLVAFASMPVVYTATAASGTVDNPTLPVSESNSYSQSQTNNLSFLQESLKFTFYQTKDDEYFKFTQAIDADKYCGSSNINKTVNVDLSFEPADDAATTSFINSGAVITYTGNDSASSGLPFPATSALAGNYWDTTEYSWVKTTTFKGASAGQKGQQNYSYTQLLNHRVVIINSDGVTESDNSYSTEITTRITVVDVRDFMKELSRVEDIVANPSSYSSAYVSAAQAMLNDIPADLKNLSAPYSQSIVNNFTNELALLNENVADYTEFNSVLAESRAFTNDGTYSARSYAAYVEQVESINVGLPKNLSSSRQATVDAAVSALKDAKNLLVVEFSGTGSTTNSDIEDVSPWVENEFNFIQVADDQVLAFTQCWTMYRGTKSSNRMFYITLDTTDANTAAFAPRFTTDCVTTVPSIVSGAFEGTLSNQSIFTNWYEVDANGVPDPAPEAIVDGLINPDYAGFQNGETYYFRNGLSFKGMSAGETGPKTYTYVQKVYVNWTSWAVVTTINHYNSTTYTTTLNITDARALVEEYNKAINTLENPSLHSAVYITELQRIVDSVPQDMINGTKYYTQAEVDAYYEEFTVLSESLADYSALDAAYERIEAILANPDAFSGATITAAQNAKAQADALDKGLFDSVSNRKLIADMAATLNSVADNAEARADYSTYETYIDICHSVKPTDFTGDAYREFMEVVESVESTLPLDLGTSQQSVVDDACNRLLEAYLKLTDGTITAPDSVGSAFTQDAITGEYTNGVIKFTVDYSEYNFTQTVNDEKLSIKTNLTISSADSSKAVNLTSLKISSLDASELASLDTSGNCYNSDSVTINNAENLFIMPNVQYNVVQGVELLVDADGNQYADTNGDLAWFNTWQNTSGVALSENGLIKETTLTTEDASANAEFIFASAGGGDTATKTRSYTYVLRLAWTEDGVEHHAHIPVTFNISDARSLRSTYYAYMDFINAGNDGSYTDASFQAAADIMASVNTDIVNGNGYYTQEQIDAESAKLNNALLTLQAKADYNKFNEAKVNAEAILNAPAGTYTDATINAIKNTLAEAEGLNMDLDASQQSVVDEATQKLQIALDSVQKKADYTDFDEAVKDLEEIVNSPEGTYTDETVKKAQDALDEANKVDPDLPEDENGVNQGIIDEATQNMQDVINSAEKKADYSDYNDAKSEADSLVNDDGNGNPVYDEDAFNAYKEAVNNVDNALDKDLTESEQSKVDDAVNALEDAKTALENNKYADYTDFDAAKDALEEIVNAPEGTFTEETVKKAQDALDNANTVPGGMLVGENNVNQDMIDDATQNMQDVIDSAEKKADYSEFDSVVDSLEEIINNPDNYTSETVEAAKDALQNAEDFDKDLGESQQGTVDSFVNDLKDVVNSVEKKADYTDYNNAKAEADSFVNDDGNGNPIYDEDAFNAYKEAVENVDSALNKDLPESEQSKVDDATNALADAKTELENNRKADYTDFNTVKDALEEIVNAPAGTYTDETVKNAQNALDNANQIPDNLVVGENNVNQDMIDDATQNMQDVIDSAEKKADYAEFDKVVEDLENIVNAPEGTYTDETVKNAQDALDGIVDVDKDMADTEQGILDEITAGLKDVVDSAEKKADYTEFDKVVEDLENIVNAPEGTYTDETVKNAQDALQNAENFDKDLNESQQGTVDSFVNDLKDVVSSAENKADYTDYNNTKNEADSLVNDDGNGNPVYDEDAFNAYKEAVNNIDNALNKDLPESEQSKVDEATGALDNALNTLEASKYYTVTFLDAEGNELSAERFVSGAVFGTIVAPALPESTDEIAVVGWAYMDDTLAGADDALTSDVTVKVAAEDKVLRIIDGSGLSVDSETGYIVTESRSLTVADMLAKFNNDATLLTVVDFEGNVLSTDDYVGSGAVITLESKYSDAVYESRTFVIYGDVTGDGLVDATDYAAARKANIIPGTYNESNHYFFVANDVAKDGYIDALDTAYINLMVKGYK